MKKLFAGLFFLAATSATLAAELNGPISPKKAEEIAFLYASDHVFGDLLDGDSSVIATLDSEDHDQFTFVVSARLLPQVCLVKLTISKEIGQVAENSEMLCGVIKAQTN